MGWPHGCVEENCPEIGSDRLPIRENIARSLTLDIFSRARDFSIMNTRKPGQRLANLRIFTMRNADASRKIVFHELT
jgi:hypothetical protein